jgi:threo-3-hydroxy-L-aspartate ammonia-lyase
MPPVSIDEIYAARERIRDVAVQTPLVPGIGLEVPDANRLWLKAENFQRTWSFKLRGAYNAVASLEPGERSKGVITYSSGNHGQAVACAASLLGIPAVIVMPEDAIPVKVEMTRRYGAEVVFAGHTSLDRQRRAMELVELHGYAVIPPFDDRRIIAGQGTAGLEIVEQLPELEAVVVQVGGGGLVSGVATAVKALRPEVCLIGVEPEGAADARDSWKSGTLSTWSSVETVADGLRTSRVGELNFATIRELVDDIVTVTDEEILSAVRTLVNGAKLVAEPSGAVAPAAVLTGRTGLRDTNIVAIVSGGNIDPARLRSCLEPETAPENVDVPG